MALVKRGGVWYLRKMINGQGARLEEHDSELR
jgi:hypothetical protein